MGHNFYARGILIPEKMDCFVKSERGGNLDTHVDIMNMINLLVLRYNSTNLLMISHY
jgi:hypothetical protein